MCKPYIKPKVFESPLFKRKGPTCQITTTKSNKEGVFTWVDETKVAQNLIGHSLSSCAGGYVVTQNDEKMEKRGIIL